MSPSHDLSGYLSAEAVAEMLFNRGEDRVRTGSNGGLALAIVDACDGLHLRAGRMSDDFDAIRSELARLWGETLPGAGEVERSAAA